MLSVSHAEREATLRLCLPLKDSGYSFAADTDLAGCPGVLSLWLPWCLKYAFALTQYEFDTSVSKLHPKSPDRLSSGRELTVYKLSQYFHIFCVSVILLLLSLLLLIQFLFLIILWYSMYIYSFSHSSGVALGREMSVQHLLDGLTRRFVRISMLFWWFFSKFGDSRLLRVPHQRLPWNYVWMFTSAVRDKL